MEFLKKIISYFKEKGIEPLKEFFIMNGFTSVGFLAAWLILWSFFGMSKIAFFFLGVFVCKNWYVIKKIWERKVKPEIEDMFDKKKV
ncbi:MAG: hypothetical protein ACOCVF_01510 [bacterium]